jgi:hypothetical protein
MNGEAAYAGIYVLEPDGDLHLYAKVGSEKLERPHWKVNAGMKTEAFWRIAVEAMAKGATLESVQRLIRLRRLTDEDGVRWARGMGLEVARTSTEHPLWVTRVYNKPGSVQPEADTERFSLGGTLVESLAGILLDQEQIPKPVFTQSTA